MIAAMKKALEALGICESMLPEYHQWLSDAQYELRAAVDAAERQEQCPAPEMMGEHACKNKSQCWEPCGDLGHSEAHVCVAERQEPVFWMIECSNSFTGWWDGRMPMDCRFFNSNPIKCKTFATKEEAENLIALQGNSCMIATEQMWIDGPPKVEQQEPVAAESHGCHGGDGATISRLDELESENVALKYSLQLDEDLIGKIQQIIGVLANRPTQFITPQQPAIPAWQPIETAPRDGTDILAMYMHIDTQIVHNAFWNDYEDAEEEEIGWWSYEHSEVSRIKLDDWMTPTHWMPLPAAPKKEKSDVPSI